MSNHLLDRLAALSFRVTPRASTVFPDGWGDESLLSLLTTPAVVLEPEPLDIAWSRKEEHPGYRVRRGQFLSPVAADLPEPARLVPVEWLEPGAGGGRVCILLPAWNDHGFGKRRRLAAALAERGIASVSFDIPYYGARRVVAIDRQAIRTVADFALMGYGAVHEAVALAAHLRREAVVGFSGYSMGGNLAALASAMVPFPVAIAPLAASHSPGPVYLDGVLRSAIDWAALGGRQEADRLRSVLGAASVLTIRPADHHRAAVLVVAERDGFIPDSASQALAAHWPGAEVRVVAGAGHATLLWRQSAELVSAIHDAFDRFDQLGSR
jgi:pimeloyl-ACP methyl ester carboxylesterase